MRRPFFYACTRVHFSRSASIKITRTHCTVTSRRTMKHNKNCDENMKEPLRSDEQELHENGKNSLRKSRPRRLSRKVKVLILVLAVVLTVILVSVASLVIYITVERSKYNASQFHTSNSSEYLQLMTDMLVRSSSGNWSNVTDSLSWPMTSNRTAGFSNPSYEPLLKVNPPWRDCGSKIGKVLAVYTEQCRLQDGRCLLPVGTRAMLEMAFVVKRDVRLVGVKACGQPTFLRDVISCIESPLEEQDPCVNSNLQCPLAQNGVYLYRTVGGLREDESPLPLLFDVYTDLYFRLLDKETKELIFCIMFPAIITPPS